MRTKLQEELGKISELAMRKLKGGARVSPVTVGAANDSSPNGGGGSCSPMRGGGSARDIMDFLNSLGGVPCRPWGAEPPGQVDPRTGCPIGKKVCGMIYPLSYSVPAASVNNEYTILAKHWYWPIFYVDGGTSVDVTMSDLQFQGDTVWENGSGSGPLTPASLFPPTGNYSFLPGLPAINSVNGLAHYLDNVAVGDELFQGMYLGISIRN